jgi:multiple sugar transport system permease protein
MVEYSFYNMSYTKNRGFIGLKNYISVFTKEELFSTFRISLYYMVGALVQIALALYFATILSFRTKGTAFYKGAMFFPFLVNGIAIGFIFKFFYTRGYVLDTTLGFLGIPLDSLPFWLRDVKLNNWSLVATSVWKYMGQNMVLFAGAIMSVDPNLYEAASIDGANGRQMLRHVTFPMVAPSITICTFLTLTNVFKTFDQNYALTGGAPGKSTSMLALDIFQTFYGSVGKEGVGQAKAVVFFLILAAFAAVQQGIARRKERGAI